MNHLLNDFTEYLLSIGILSKDSLVKLHPKGDMSSLKKKDIESTFKQSMTDSIVSLIFSLKQEQKKLLGESIIQKYIDNSKRKKIKLLRISILIVNSHYQIYNITKLRNSFNQWSNINIKLSNANHLTTSAHLKNYTNTTNIINYTKVQRSKSEIPNYIKENHIIVDNNITKTLKSFNILKDTFEQFEQRQKKFNLQKKKHSITIEDEKDRLLSRLCTFTPQISSYPIRRNKSSYCFAPIRLYKESKERRNRQIKRERQQEEQIKQNCNRNAYNISISKIEQLYKEYKLKKLEKKNLIIKTDIEQGFTYQPRVNHDKYHKKVVTTFQEREQNFIQDKIKYKEENDEQFKRSQRENQVGYIRLEKENKEEIAKKAINRLYLIKNQRVNEINTENKIKKNIYLSNSNNINTTDIGRNIYSKNYNMEGNISTHSYGYN